MSSQTSYDIPDIFSDKLVQEELEQVDAFSIQDLDFDVQSDIKSQPLQWVQTGSKKTPSPLVKTTSKEVTGPPLPSSPVWRRETHLDAPLSGLALKKAKEESSASTSSTSTSASTRPKIRDASMVTTSAPKKKKHLPTVTALKISHIQKTFDLKILKKTSMDSGQSPTTTPSLVEPILEVMDSCQRKQDRL
ncbi:hypothetical protein NDU88_007722 [Pleurodeles waltl]|uniref:Uncharacterized protein n=1 Tax=Pleurodeles waltl TaxID=8319 RepID=A0AAV7RUW4_PLEWA|nr:hypothetical protein NDU88_007722 [Pleurodeles waltl]